MPHFTRPALSFKVVINSFFWSYFSPGDKLTHWKRCNDTDQWLGPFFTSLGALRSHDKLTALPFLSTKRRKNGGMLHNRNLNVEKWRNVISSWSNKNRWKYKQQRSSCMKLINLPKKKDQNRGAVFPSSGSKLGADGRPQQFSAFSYGALTRQVTWSPPRQIWK